MGAGHAVLRSSWLGKLHRPSGRHPSPVPHAHLRGHAVLRHSPINTGSAVLFPDKSSSSHNQVRTWVAMLCSVTILMRLLEASSWAYGEELLSKMALQCGTYSVEVANTRSICSACARSWGTCGSGGHSSNGRAVDGTVLARPWRRLRSLLGHP